MQNATLPDEITIHFDHIQQPLRDRCIALGMPPDLSSAALQAWLLWYLPDPSKGEVQSEQHLTLKFF